MKQDQVDDLLLQALAQERAAVRVYQAALRCAVHPDLRDEWRDCLAETRRHERVLEQALERLGMDPELQTACREVVTVLADALVRGMTLARDAGDPQAAQLMAADCVWITEFRLQAIRELLSRVAHGAEGELRGALLPAAAELEDTGDDHLLSARRWSRELWNQALGLDTASPGTGLGVPPVATDAPRPAAWSDAH